MRAVIQRVSEAAVAIAGRPRARIGPGLLVLLGVGEGDTGTDADYVARKVAEVRIFEDDEGKMNRSVEEAGGGVLVISQFTLYGDCRKGRRPSFSDACDRSPPRSWWRRSAGASPPGVCGSSAGSSARSWTSRS